jgi:hypothetical protein
LSISKEAKLNKDLQDKAKKVWDMLQASAKEELATKG